MAHTGVFRPVSVSPPSTPTSSRNWRTASSSPHKRTRIEPPRSHKARDLGTPLSDADLALARSSSVTRLRAVWEDIARRAKEEAGKDDVVDLETGEIIEDYGVLREAKARPIGSYALADAVTDDEDEADESEEAEGSDEEEEDDRSDALRHLGTPPAVEPALVFRRSPSSGVRSPPPRTPSPRRASPGTGVTPIVVRLQSQTLRESPNLDSSDSEDELALPPSPLRHLSPSRRSPSRMSPLRLSPARATPVHVSGSTSSPLRASSKAIFMPHVPFPTPPPSHTTSSPSLASPPPRRPVHSEPRKTYTPTRFLFSPSPSPEPMPPPPPPPTYRPRAQSVHIFRASKNRTTREDAAEWTPAPPVRRQSMSPGKGKSSPMSMPPRAPNGRFLPSPKRSGGKARPISLSPSPSPPPVPAPLSESESRESEEEEEEPVQPVFGLSSTDDDDDEVEIVSVKPSPPRRKEPPLIMRPGYNLLPWTRSTPTPAPPARRPMLESSDDEDELLLRQSSPRRVMSSPTRRS